MVHGLRYGSGPAVALHQRSARESRLVPPTIAQLEKVFGSESTGRTPEERAKSSSKKYVRSQVQIAHDSPRATGRRLSAWEALDAYGWETLAEVTDEGAAPLISGRDEPAATLRSRRKALGLAVKEVARATHLSPERVAKAEQSGNLLPIRDLEQIAQALALDERLLGSVPGARGDDALGVRLRQMAQMQDEKRFSPSDVLALTEAAWVISKQISLCKWLGDTAPKRFLFDSNYAYPTYERGYELAARTRSELNLHDEEPIHLRPFVEERLSIPIVQQAMSPRFAGATVVANGDRGIVVNEAGSNENVWVRRMTIAHELGHLLWDPESKLDKLKVDRYSDVQHDYRGVADVAEIRANAFAVSFLAPPQIVSEIARKTEDKASAVADVMTRFGISSTAAKHHIKNVSGIDVSDVKARDLPHPSDEWIATENLTLDWFPIDKTPVSRRGRFASFVARTYERGLISDDTAAVYLKSKAPEIQKHFHNIMDVVDSNEQ